MEYQIRFHWTAMGPGTFGADEQTLRLRGYAAARTKVRTWWIFCVILGTLCAFCDLETVNSHIETLLGLSHGWWTGPIFAGLVGAGVGAVFSAVFSWPASTTHEEFEKRLVTCLRRENKKISFDLPNPFKPGKFLHVKFYAKSIEEAEQIEQALPKSKVEDGAGRR